MKKITIIETLPCEKNICNGNDCEKCCSEHSKVEQVPETWNELEKLCKELNVETVFNHKSIMLNHEISVWDNGVISYNNIVRIAENRTISQMWTIIKSLIGE